MRILLAMSGGVDSSTVAHLLKKEGHDVVGVHFLLWMDPKAPAEAQIQPKKCCSTEMRNRVKRVTEDLEIPLHQIDLSNEFKCEVVDPFLRAYEKGLTPNPCVLCNRIFKHAQLIKLADEFGCEKVATGHYVRVKNDEDGMTHLLEAADATKDQSYYLYRLSQEQLKRSIFPLGEMMKKDVIKLARSFGIPLPKDYQQSQDICFFPEKEPHAFLDRYLEEKPGDIIDMKNEKRGKHRGLFHYTEGQRKGLGIGGLKIPLHVVRKDVESNTIVVGTKEEASGSEFEARDLTWPSQVPEENVELEFDVRIHALGERIPAVIKYDGEVMEVKLKKPTIGISPGQSVVVYRDNEVIGGGVIGS